MQHDDDDDDDYDDDIQEKRGKILLKQLNITNV